MSKRGNPYLRTLYEIKKDDSDGYWVIEKFPNKNINPVFLPRTYVEKKRKGKEKRK